MISIGFASGSTPGKKAKNAWYKDYVCGLSWKMDDHLNVQAK